MTSLQNSVVRVSQRPTTRCTECATRRVKCSRNVPCDPCIKRGREAFCEREPVVVMKGKLAAAPVPGLMKPGVNVGTQTPRWELESVRQAEGAESLPIAMTPDDAQIYEADLSAVGLLVPPNDFSSSKRKAEHVEEAAWRRARLTGRLLDLIPLRQSTQLVKASLQLHGVLHAAVHVPTYLEEHATWLASLTSGETELEPEWLALYFSIICVGVYFMEADMASQVGLSEEEMAAYPALWFNASLEALDESDFMANHSLESCQAITVLTLAAHAFGPSSRMFTLHSCAIHIAQSLGLHLLGAESDTPLPGLIQREVGRRVWLFLLNQQRLSPSAQQPGALFTSRGRTIRPANCEDEDIVNDKFLFSKPLHVPTLMTNQIAKAAIADIMKDFFCSFYNVTSTLLDQQRAVAEADFKLIHFFDDFPTLRPYPSPYPQSFDLKGPPHVIQSIRWTWEQHLWSIIVPHRRLLIHRAFLSRSFKDLQYEPSRQICLAAARDILRERQRPIPALFDKLWHVSADIISAGFILGIIARYTVEPERCVLRDEVLSCIQVLGSKRVQNKIVDRGIALLQQLLVDSEVADFFDGPHAPLSPASLATAYAADSVGLFGDPVQGDEAWEGSFSWAFPSASDLYGFWSTDDESQQYDPHAPALGFSSLLS